MTVMRWCLIFLIVIVTICFLVYILVFNSDLPEDRNTNKFLTGNDMEINNSNKMHITWDFLLNRGFVDTGNSPRRLTKSGLSENEAEQFYNLVGGGEKYYIPNLPDDEVTYILECGDFCFSVDGREIQKNQWVYTITAAMLKERTKSSTLTVPKMTSENEHPNVKEKLK